MKAAVNYQEITLALRAYLTANVQNLPPLLFENRAGTPAPDTVHIEERMIPAAQAHTAAMYVEGSGIYALFVRTPKAKGTDTARQLVYNIKLAFSPFIPIETNSGSVVIDRAEDLPGYDQGGLAVFYVLPIYIKFRIHVPMV